MVMNAAIVGLGWWGKHLLKKMRDSQVLRFAAAVGNEESQREVADEFGVPFTTDFDSVLKDDRIDMIVLTTPHALHAPQVLKAAEHRKHVFCEKPLALTVADAVECVRACERAGVRLGLGHERRFEGAMMELRRVVRRGELGRIVHAEGNFSHDKLANVPTEHWRFTDAHLAPVPMTATGIHVTDLMLDLLGDVTEAYAAAPTGGASGANRALSLHLRFGSGATGYVNTVLETPFYMRLGVFGTAGWAEVRNFTRPDAGGEGFLRVRLVDGTERLSRYEWNDSVRDNLEAFCRAVAKDTIYPITPEQMVANVAVMAAVTESLYTNRPVQPAPAGK